MALRVFFRVCSLQNEVGDLPFFYILTSLTHHLTVVKVSEKNQCWKIFALTSLKQDLVLAGVWPPCCAMSSPLGASAGDPYR